MHGELFLLKLYVVFTNLPRYCSKLVNRTSPMTSTSHFCHLGFPSPHGTSCGALLAPPILIGGTVAELSFLSQRWLGGLQNLHRSNVSLLSCRGFALISSLKSLFLAVAFLSSSVVRSCALLSRNVEKVNVPVPQRLLLLKYRYITQNESLYIISKTIPNTSETTARNIRKYEAKFAYMKAGIMMTIIAPSTAIVRAALMRMKERNFSFCLKIFSLLSVEPDFDDEIVFFFVLRIVMAL